MCPCRRGLSACSRCGIVDRIWSHKRAVGRPALLCSRPFWAPAQHPCSRIIVGPEHLLSTRFRHSHRPTWEVWWKWLSFSHGNQLERCPQVSVRRIFCYGRGELVFFLAWRERSFSFLRIFRNDAGILILSRLHTFRPVSDLLLFRVHQKMIWRKSATSRRCKPRVGTCHRAECWQAS
jgi:hypothetical protein